jgi:hypothetical protein
MSQLSSARLLVIALFVNPAFSQQPKSTPPDASGVAAEVLTFERNIEAAVVRGDVAYVAGALSNDFSFTHGDGWTTGGKPLAVDDKKSFLKRVESRQYTVHNIDTVKVEMHGDIAITYGRYTSHYLQNWNSVWFERIYAKRDGQWWFLSHRTVHGPTSDNPANRQ